MELCITMNRGLVNMMAFGYLSWLNCTGHSWCKGYKTSCVMRFFIFENNKWLSCSATGIYVLENSLLSLSFSLFLYFYVYI